MSQPNTRDWSGILSACAQHLGTSAESGTFWFQLTGEPSVQVEFNEEPPVVLLHAPLGNCSDGAGEGWTPCALLSANAGGQANGSNYYAIDGVDGTLLLCTRLEGADMADPDSALHAMVRFSAAAAQAHAALHADAAAGPAAAQPQETRAVDTHLRERNAGQFHQLWQEMVRVQGLLETEQPREGEPLPLFRTLETGNGDLLHVECEPDRGDVVLSAVMSYLPQVDDRFEDEDPEGELHRLRPLLESHLDGQATAGGVFALNPFDELVLQRRLPLDGLDGVALWNAVEALAGVAVQYAKEMDLQEA